MELKQSNVLFNEEQHTYTLGDATLSGITSIIHHYIFPDMYSGIAQSVLDKAAERGTHIHHLVQLSTLGLLPDEDRPEIEPFITATQGIEWLASEYLVSDNQHVASAIDLIGMQDSKIYLYDVKTTAVLNEEYLRWQLSIYAYLFVRQNKDITLSGLKAIHIRDGKCNIVDIDPLPEDYVEALLNAYITGAETFDNPLRHIPSELSDLLTQYAANETALAEVDAARAPLDEQKKALQESIAAVLAEKGVNTIDCEQAKVTIGKDSVRQTFDFKKFADSDVYKANTDTFNKYLKTSTVKGRVTITLR